MNKDLINVKEVMFTSYCIDEADGIKLKNIIKNKLSTDDTVDLNFKDILIITSVFFRCMLEDLIKEFGISILDNISVYHITSTDFEIYKMITNSLKMKYRK